MKYKIGDTEWHKIYTDEGELAVTTHPHGAGSFMGRDGVATSLAIKLETILNNPDLEKLHLEFDRCRRRAEALEKLIRHADIHSSYKFCGYRKMTEPQRWLWREVNGWDEEMHETAIQG